MPRQLPILFHLEHDPGKDAGNLMPFSWLRSPDGKTELSFEQIKKDDPEDTCEGKTISRQDELFPYVVVRVIDAARQIKTVAGCFSWDGLQLVNWLDNQRAILRAGIDRNGDNKLTELFLFDIRTAKFTRIGLFNTTDGPEIRDNILVSPEMNTVMAIRPEQIDVDGSLTNCYVVWINLISMKEKRLQSTLCNYPADFVWLKGRQQIAFLTYIRKGQSESDQVEGKAHFFTPATQSLETVKTQPIQKIGAPSPDERYLLFVTDPGLNTTARAQRIQFETPSALIYDMQLHKVLYTHPFDVNVNLGPSPVFRWAPDSKGILLVDHGDVYISLPTLNSVKIDDAPTYCTDWEWTDKCMRRSPAWSSGGKYLLVYTKEGAKVVRRSDVSMIAVTQFVDSEAFVIIINWTVNERLIIDVFKNSDEDPIQETLKRWQVDLTQPAK